MDSMYSSDDYQPLKLPDYVPEPQPAASEYLVGVHYFPGWKAGTHTGWDAVRPYPDRKPLLGYYEEGNPEVADWEVKWCLEHGVQYFIYCWYRDRDNVGKPVTPEAARLGHAVHDGLLHARYLEQFQFAIMWENYGARGMVGSLEDLRDNLLPYWIRYFFSHESYLRLDGRPVFYVYHPDSLMEQLGGIDGAKEALDTIRQAVSRAGLGDVIILGEHRSKDLALLNRMKDCGFDASFAYCWHPPQQYPTWQEAAEAQLDFMEFQQTAAVLPAPCTASVGWDPWPWGRTAEEAPNAPWLHLETMKRWYGTPVQFRDLLVEIKQRMDALPAEHIGRKMLLLDNWNEWAEGHYIAPHAAGGFGYLQAVREVFTQRNNLPDYRTPEQLGFGPYEKR